MRKLVKAIDYFGEAFASTPKDHELIPLSCEYIGAIYHSLGHLDDAQDWLIKAARADASRPTPHIQLGDVFLKLEKFDLAEEAYLNTIDIEPNYALAYNKLSELYSHLGREKEAKENAEKAKKLIESGMATSPRAD